MHKENKLGIKVYDTDTFIINSIDWSVNSISIDGQINKLHYFRQINNKNYGFKIKKEKIYDIK